MFFSSCSQDVSSSISNGNTSIQDTSNDSTNDDKGLLGLDVLPDSLENNLVISYHRDDKSYSSWALWLWSDNKDGSEYLPNYYQDDDIVFSYPLETFTKNDTFKIGVIVKSKGNWSSKDVENDRFISSDDFTKDKNGNIRVYLYSGIEKMYQKKQESFFSINDCLFLNFRTIDVLCYYENAISYTLYKNGKVLISDTFKTSKHKFQINLDSDMLLSDLYTVKVKSESGLEESKNVSITRLYDTETFTSLYNYDGELGAIYSHEKTTFRVWSPLSSKIELRIYNSGTPKSVSIDKGDDTYSSYLMALKEKGVFEYTLSGDLEGKYYTYVVTNNYYQEKEIVDPYAKSSGISSFRGMIVDFSKTEIEGWNDFTKAKSIDRKALTVYESHVSDITASSTWNGSESNRKKFLGLVEEGTTYTSDSKTVKTGFDHIKELGVNAVQLLPIFDQANDESKDNFNWGYNPKLYNVLEGSYSSDPYDGYTRIKEFKKVVLEYQKAGINVIMDVVYNHVNSVTGENFDVLCPYYYFRYSSDVLTNGSGCGNETKSEHFMFKKFMIDSASFWLKEYKLGGFRFDLMGLHDLDTMNELVSKLKEINEDVIVYGEPWTGGNSALATYKQACQSNTSAFNGYGQFNDQMRDGLIKSGMKGDAEYGFITGTIIQDSEIKSVIAGIKGETMNASKDPNKTVNYVTCHDNYTLYDRFVAFEKANQSDKTLSITTEVEKMKMNLLANSIVFSSQGTSFMLAGEEMLRSKGNDLSIAKNSYNASNKVNELDYSNLIKYSNMMNVYKKVISLKQNFAGLRKDEAEAQKIIINTTSKNNMISFTLSDENREYIFYFNNGLKNEEGIDLSSYTLYMDSIKEDKILSSNTTIEKYEALIGYKDK